MHSHWLPSSHLQIPPGEMQISGYYSGDFFFLFFWKCRLDPIFWPAVSKSANEGFENLITECSTEELETLKKCLRRSWILVVCEHCILYLGLRVGTCFLFLSPSPQLGVSFTPSAYPVRQGPWHSSRPPRTASPSRSHEAERPPAALNEWILGHSRGQPVHAETHMTLSSSNTGAPRPPASRGICCLFSCLWAMPLQLIIRAACMSRLQMPSMQAKSQHEPGPFFPLTVCTLKAQLLIVK